MTTQRWNYHQEMGKTAAATAHKKGATREDAGSYCPLITPINIEGFESGWNSFWEKHKEVKQ